MASADQARFRLLLAFEVVLAGALFVDDQYLLPTAAVALLLIGIYAFHIWRAERRGLTGRIPLEPEVLVHQDKARSSSKPPL